MRKLGKLCSIFDFCQYFTNILWINLHTTFILQNFGLKLHQCVSYYFSKSVDKFEIAHKLNFGLRCGFPINVCYTQVKIWDCDVQFIGPIFPDQIGLIAIYGGACHKAILVNLCPNSTCLFEYYIMCDLHTYLFWLQSKQEDYWDAAFLLCLKLLQKHF